MSGLQHSTTYMMLPTTLACGIKYIFFPPLSMGTIALKGICGLDVLTALALSILNLFNTFYMFPPEDKWRIPLLLSLKISIPRIFFPGHRSFILNSFDNAFFNLSMPLTLLLAICMSSIYSSKYKVLSSSRS